ADGIDDQKVDDRIDLHRHVVARDDRLRLDLGNLLAQVDRLADGVQEGDDRIEARFGRPVVFTEAFDDLHLLLRGDLNPLHQNDHDEEREADQDERHAGLTSRTMPSAPTTLICVPAATLDPLRAAQSWPPMLTRPVPLTGSIGSVTTPARPISTSVRPGT